MKHLFATWSLPVLVWLEQILSERFGHRFQLEGQDNEVHLRLPAQLGFIAIKSSVETFARSDSNLPYTKWAGAKEGWDEILGKPLPVPGEAILVSPLIEQQTESFYIHYDILGLAYWMLSRQEEVGRTDLDGHGRFPATSSHAYKYDYLERPVVDEWLNILGQVIQRQWPSVELKKHVFSMKVSHDVDAPSLYAFKSWVTVFRMMAGHIIKRKDIKAFFAALYVKLATRTKLHRADPYNTFDWLMTLSEENNLTSAFYFICGRTSTMDADYELEHPVIKELLQHIYRRGHEIGLHPSYGTYQAPRELKREADHLSTVCSKLGIKQEHYGGRMHYLRWDHPVTLQAWNDAGLRYDSTLSYADRPGFRCGTCFEYPAFNPDTQQILQIRIRPLIAMECTVIDDAYLGLGVTEQAQNKFLALKDACRKVNGCFTLLWHNSYFSEDARLAALYMSCVED